LTIFDRAESAGCTDPDLNYCRGLIYLQQSRFDQVEKAVKHILTKDPENIPALHLKAKALDSIGELREAVECYNKIMELSAVKEENKDPAEE